MDSEALTTLAGMATTGRLHAPVAKVFDLNHARAAYQAFGSRTGRGRIVLSFPGT
jgi:NADPH:quinone reductase-like Zn-dependent oxidoreductase